MDEVNKKLKYLRKKVESMETDLKRIRKQIEKLEEKNREEYDGSWYENHGHGD